MSSLDSHTQLKICSSIYGERLTTRLSIIHHDILIREDFNSEVNLGVLKNMMTLLSSQLSSKETLLCGHQLYHMYFTVPTLRTQVKTVTMLYNILLCDNCNVHSEEKVSFVQNGSKILRVGLPDFHDFFQRKKCFFQENCKDDKNGLIHPEN